MHKELSLVFTVLKRYTNFLVLQGFPSDEISDVCDSFFCCHVTPKIEFSSRLFNPQFQHSSTIQFSFRIQLSLT